MQHVYFVRHGESTSNRDKVRYGPAAPLTEVGESQAAAVAQRFKTIPVELVLASPYERAYNTGAAIAAAAGVPLEIVDLARERELPDSVIGKSRHDPEAIRIVDEITTSWLAGSSHAGAESFTKILERVDALQAVIRARPETHIVVASHQLFGKFFLGRVLLGEFITPRLSYEINHHIRAENTGIHHYKVDDEGVWHLVSWNDSAHLGEL